MISWSIFFLVIVWIGLIGIIFKNVFLIGGVFLVLKEVFFVLKDLNVFGLIVYVKIKLIIIVMVVVIRK